MARGRLLRLEALLEEALPDVGEAGSSALLGDAAREASDPLLQPEGAVPQWAGRVEAQSAAGDGVLALAL